jgi:hypothetical protein
MSKKRKYPDYQPKNKQEEEEADAYFNNGGNPNYYNEKMYERDHPKKKPFWQW